ncbi:MAG: hypothetical protein QME96_17985, partial [Myxococcota bacterium]|nr:hypothetical protein [Myxococcota bacterium]
TAPPPRTQALPPVIEKLLIEAGGPPRRSPSGTNSRLTPSPKARSIHLMGRIHQQAAIRLHVQVGHDHTVRLPDDVPEGPVENWRA